MLEAYNTEDGHSIQGKRYADKDKESVLIMNPSYSSLGATTESSLRSFLSEENLASGIMNREVLIAPSDNDATHIQKDVKLSSSLKAHIYKIALLAEQAPVLGKYKDTTFSVQAEETYKVRIGSVQIQGSDLYRYTHDDDGYVKELNLTLSQRWRENALRLATAFTVFEGKTIITEEMMVWWYNFVKSCGIYAKSTFLQSSSNMKTIRLTDYFHRKHKDEKFTPNQLSRSGTGMFRGKPANEVRDILDDLIDKNILTVLIEDEEGNFTEGLLLPKRSPNGMKTWVISNPEYDATIYTEPVEIWFLDVLNESINIEAEETPEVVSIQAEMSIEEELQDIHRHIPKIHKIEISPEEEAEEVDYDALLDSLMDEESIL